MKQVNDHLENPISFSYWNLGKIEIHSYCENVKASIKNLKTGKKQNNKQLTLKGKKKSRWKKSIGIVIDKPAGTMSMLILF